MSQPGAGVQYSEDGHYWWDEQAAAWQPVAADAPGSGSDAGAVAGSGSDAGAGSGSAAPPQPALITLAGGESSWEPDPVIVGQPITVKWRELNSGGPSQSYTTNVALKKGDDVGNELDVPCEPLGANEHAWREAELKGPLSEDLDYAIEIFVDSKNATFHNEANWAHMEIEVRSS
jgi:hypothetical protein